MRPPLALLAGLLLLAGCAAPQAPSGHDATVTEAPPLAADVAPSPPSHTTKTYTFVQDPDATVRGTTLVVSSNELQGLPRPAGLTRVILETVWSRYAEPTGLEQVILVVGGGGHAINRTTEPDARGVLTLTIAAEEMEDDLVVALYPRDGKAMLPGQYTVHATVFANGEPPAGFTAVP